MHVLLEQAALSAHLGGAPVELLPGNVSAPPGFHLFMPNLVGVLFRFEERMFFGLL
jgi:hypothetical protein